MSRILPTSLTRGYISRWTVSDAVRELIQNALDIGDYNFETTTCSITIESFGGTIDIKNLLLGQGTKTNDSSKLGGFSEGLLLALLICARDNVDIEFINGDKTWKPIFDYNGDFGCECLYIEEDDADDVHDGVKITLNLDSSTVSDIVDRTLHLQDEYEKHETAYGEILLNEEHSGKIFVGGLFISRFDSKYGFNFHPEDFPLDRDRKSLQPFDIKWRVKDMWAEVAVDADEDTADDIVDSIVKRDDSFEHTYEHSLQTESVIKSAEKLYNNKYSGKLVVSDWKEAKSLEKAGNINVELVNNQKLVSLIQKSESYKTVVLGKIEPKDESIPALLEEFEDKYYNDMSSDMLRDWEELKDKVLQEV
ncbi:hypothetical protein VPHG_00065 [Vibrio phage 11895-B1]|uniref:hypothetical protein n=1 Tax=Vibrio phage 11895-B1 TaxID=754075 RepID=UPI0002C145B7|nr:hypothetical protein VPHG_00065 [Vibrio phage 11895-B1]AGH32132.1 hypothetical protein VPHG_00065 [Vibrio phage 11895-B1]